MKFNIENRRYTGSKEKLKNWIFDLIMTHCKGNSFLDLFGGTGVITAKALEYFSTVKINDLLFSNEIIYKAFLSPINYDIEKLKYISSVFNNIKEENENYFSKNYGGKYFRKEDAKIIWNIRGVIEKKYSINEINEKEYAILLASLIYSVDRIANTVGHYDAYFKTRMRNDKFVFELIKPIETFNKKVEIYREDSNKLVRNLTADIVYIDPPYNSRQYSRFYHVLETLFLYEERELFGVALKPTPENMSDFCRKKAPEVFKDLIENIDAKYIIVSYNNTYNSKSSSSENKIKLEEIENILSLKGDLLKFEQAYKSFNTGKTDFADHKELIYITKVKN